MSVSSKEQAVNIGRMIASELKHEATATRKMIERVPNEKFS